MEKLLPLFEADDFAAAADRLGRDFRRDHGLGPIHQLGLAVPDVTAAAASLEARGIGPFFIAAGAPSRWRERGQDRSFAGQLGMAYHQGLELELLAPGQGSDFYRRSLDPEGAIVVQHLGLLADDVDAEAAKLEAAGFPVYVRGQIKTGPLVTEFAYLDTEAAAGLVIEFISWRLFGRPVRVPPSVFHGLGRIEKLIGLRSFKV